MARLIPIMVFALATCSAFGQYEENKILDSLLNKFVTDKEDPMGLQRSLEFLGLPSNIDVSRLTFDEPIRMYAIINDPSLMTLKNFKINRVIKPLDGWKIPFKYDGNYCSSLQIEKVEGKYAVSDIKQYDTTQWINAERRAGKDKLGKRKLLRYRHNTFLHHPDVDDYNLLPLNQAEDLDTTSDIALASPLKLNSDKVRERLKADIINDLHSNRAGKSK